MTPVKKDHLLNLSQSVSANIATLNTHKSNEILRVKNQFKDLKQLLEARERWMLDQLDQLTKSQVAILESQKATVEQELRFCGEEAIQMRKECLPLYCFSEAQMPTFVGNSEDVRDCLLSFGRVTSKDAAVAFGDTVEGCESKAEKDELMTEKWLQNSHREHLIHPEFEHKMDFWLNCNASDRSFEKVATDMESVSELMLDMWSLKEHKELPPPTAITTTATTTNNQVLPQDYQQWIRREACRLTCPPEQKHNLSAMTVEIEDLNQLKCVANEETGGSPVSHYLGGFSNNCEMKKWLANASRFSAHSTMEAASSACSSVTNMAYFCEANEVCGSFEECIEDNPSESCLGKYNEWLAASSYKKCNKPKSVIQMEDKHLWLAPSKNNSCDDQVNMTITSSHLVGDNPKSLLLQPKVNFSWTSNAHPWGTGVNYWLAQ